MAYSEQHLKNQAALLARKHPANNPLRNPAAMSQYTPDQQNLIAAIANHPVASVMATQTPLGQASTPTASGAPGPGTPSATPIDGHPIYKTPTTRHNIIGCTYTGPTAAGTTTGISATPQNPFAASRFVMSAVTLGLMSPGGLIGNWKVGSKSQFAAIGSEPMGLFAAGLTGGRVRFTKCAAAIAISAQISATPATASFYAGFVGTAGKRKDNGRPPPQYCKEDRVAIPPVAVAPGASGNLIITPTRSFWGTTIILDDNLTGTYGLAPGTGASNFVLADLLVGSDSQFMTAPSTGNGVPYVPAGMLNGLHSPPLDLDRAYTSQQITFEYVNVGSVTATFSGVILGDVDKRQDVETDDTDIDSSY